MRLVPHKRPCLLARPSMPLSSEYGKIRRSGPDYGPDFRANVYGVAFVLADGHVEGPHGVASLPAAMYGLKCTVALQLHPRCLHARRICIEFMT